MSGFESRWNPESSVAQQRRAAMLARLDALRAIEERAAGLLRRDAARQRARAVGLDGEGGVRRRHASTR